MLAAGARMVGKTRTDELTYSLTGENELVLGEMEHGAAPVYRRHGRAR